MSPGNGGKEREKENAETNKENIKIEMDGKGQKDDKKKNLKTILKKETPKAEPKDQDGFRSTEEISSNENLENRPKLKYKGETTLKENLYQDFLSKVTMGPIILCKRKTKFKQPNVYLKLLLKNRFTSNLKPNCFISCVLD